ncbi:Serine/threonine-protein kinase AfsK [Lacipirellula limnantheis]|uniref:Serine/threonine-protein kinase AfsK n=2 Tax=Lacipirellula limnantheis TaxID=2528024 RepID=A0A517TRS5_9BACT|nr:Serine/threonine-protein kinase AfsK [Lacipirellula limnantheis]
MEEIVRMNPTLWTCSLFSRTVAFRTAVFALLALTGLGSRSSQAEGPLVTREMAASKGLERAWFAQIPVDAGRNRVTTWYLYFDRLYGVTDSGVITALNAETGEQLWAKQVGRPGHPAFGPGANADYISVVSGGKLYVLDRHSGRMKWIRELGSAPSSGPALSSNYAYVALLTGRIEGYKLDDPKTQPWYYQSKGRTYLRPTVTGKVVSWPTASGYLYVADAEQPHVLFRLKTSGDIVTSPAQQSPNLFVASLDGYLYSINELTGHEDWRYSTGYAITSSPAVVGDMAFVASFEPAIHAIDSKTGAEKWITPGVSHFAARGKDRVYAADEYGHVLILDSATGRPLGQLPVAEGLTTLVNDQTDRIFLVNDRGLVQCLHEVGVNEPILYRQPVAPPKAADAPSAGETPPAAPPEPPADEAAEPAGDEPAPADDGDAFGDEQPPAADAPAADAPADDNPFGEP